MISFKKVAYSALIICLCSACATKKKKGETGWLGKFYHNTTAKYNGYFNADVLLDKSMKGLEAQHQDNYTQLLDIYPYVAVDNPKAFAPDLDKAIEKVSIVAHNHEPSHWVDDCYVLMGKAQYLKHDYESAEETFSYFVEQFDPYNPSSRYYQKPNVDKSEARKTEAQEKRKKIADEREASRKEKEIERKKDDKIKEAERKEKEEQKKIEDRQKEDEAEAKKKAKEQEISDKEDYNKKKKSLANEENDLKSDIAKLKKDLRSAEQDRIADEREAKKKAREQEKKDRKKGKKKKREDKPTTTTTPAISSKEQNILAKIAAKELELKKVQEEETSLVESRNVKSSLEDLGKKQEDIQDGVDNVKEGVLDKITSIKEGVEEKLSEDAGTVSDEPANLFEEEMLKAENGEEVLDEAAEEALIKKKPNAVNVSGGGLFGHRPAYGEGLLWYGRTLIERGNWISAEYAFQKLENSTAMTEDIAREVQVAKGYMYIKQKKYDLAIPALTNAIEIAKDKNQKARYAFVIAQIHEMNGDKEMAHKYYEQVVDFNPSYEMKFNAKLNAAKNSWSSDTNMSKALSSLDKMAKESKNAEYRDQIYATKGDILIAGGNKQEAIEEYKLAVAQVPGNKIVKGETYYKLASLYYDHEEYLNAKNYYDSTLQVIPTGDRRYTDIKKLSMNLREIANNIETIEVQDSLLRLGQLSEDELRTWAREKVEKEFAIMEQKEAKANAETTSEPESTINFSNTNGKASSFFAYNPLALNKGKIEFARKWSNIPNADNWRRSNALSAFVDEPEIVSENSADQAEENKKQAIAIAIRSIPRTEEQQASAHRRIKDAYFELGSLFRSKIENYDKSANAFVNLEQKYPDNDRELDAYYFQYLNYTDLKNTAKANEYLQKLKSKYPEAQYTRLLTDPSYLKELNDKENVIEDYYAQTYGHFTAGRYSEANDMAIQSEATFGNRNEYGAKFDLIHAMSVGKLEGQEAYVRALKDIVAKYPKTPEEGRAKEILRFLGGDQEAFDDRLFDEADESFVTEDDKMHYVIVVTYDLSEKNLNDAKITINAFNKKYNSLDRLKITSIFLNPDTKTQIVLIRRFADKKEALEYIESTEKNEKDFIDGESSTFDIFAITQHNYREVIKQKSVKNYTSFYDKTYQ